MPSREGPADGKRSPCAQVVLAFMSGSMLYLVRRMSGTLVLAMLVHGLWDLASFIGDGGDAVSLVVLSSNAILGLVLVLILLRRGRACGRPRWAWGAGGCGARGGLTPSWAQWADDRPLQRDTPLRRPVPAR